MDELSTLIEEVRQLRAELAEMRRMWLRSLDEGKPLRVMEVNIPDTEAAPSVSPPTGSV